MQVSDFLVERVENTGIKHIFGVPGDYVLDLYSKFCQSESIEVIGSTDENHAGFAADAYARVAGVGCVMVTYNVGALKIANAVACAYSERSPLIVISGSPGLNEREENMLLHHMVGPFESQKEVFERWTCDQAVLTDPATAGYEIDRVIESMYTYKRPVYIEMPRDIAKMSLTYDVYKQGTPESQPSDPQSLQEAMEEVVALIEEAQNPVIMAGVELSRFKLGKELMMFAEHANIPIVTTLLSKSVINERDPLFGGVYSGAASHDHTSNLVENSDCLIMLGVMLTDMTLAFKPPAFSRNHTINATIDGLKVKAHSYDNVRFDEFCQALLSTRLQPHTFKQRVSVPESFTFVPEEDTEITTARFFHKINSILDKNMAVCADIGDSIFGASDLTVHHANHFLGNAFYTSMGFAIPAALGVQTALPNTRPIVLVGDGAFQMSVSEISTIVGRGLNPIIFVLNNGGYTTERFLLDGPFNDIRDWDYHNVGALFGGIQGFKITTEAELDAAVTTALDLKEPSVLNVIVQPKDVSSALQRLTAGLSERI
jgi:indolepyruvate decarboxylase